MRIAYLSHAVFAVTMIGLGVLSLIKGSLSLRLVPKDVPAHDMLTYLCAFITIASGVGLLWQRKAALAARVLLGYFLLRLLVLRVPGFFHAVTVDVYWPVCETGALVAAAWVLYAWFATSWDRRHVSFAAGDSGLRIARAFYGLALIPFGLAHFTYLEHTASMVPSWLPWHVAWAYFFGCSFMAAGVAVLIGVSARLAAALSALQMGMFLMLVWVPVVAAGSINSFQWGETVSSWMLAIAGWVVADSYRGIPWLVADKAASDDATAGSLTL